MRRKMDCTFTPEQIRVEIQTCTVTVTVEHGSFTLATSSRGRNVLDSRDGLRKPLAMLRADLARLLGAAQGEAAGAMLARVFAPPKPAKASKVRTVTAEESAAWKVAAVAEVASLAEKLAARRERKLNPPPATEAPNFAEMTAGEFAKFNADSRSDSSWVEMDSAFGQLHPAPKPVEFPAPFAV